MKKPFQCFTIIFTVILFSYTNFSALTALEYESDVTPNSSDAARGYYPFASSAEDVHIQGTMAYLAISDGGVRIVDIRDYNNPVGLGSYQNGTYAYAVFPDGNRLYVAGGKPGLFILNISDPSSPEYLGHYNDTGDFVDVRVDGDIAYCCYHRDLTSDLLMTLNVSDPKSIEFLDSVLLGDYAERLEVVNNIVYAASRTLNGQLTIVNASDPSNLVEVQQLAIAEAQDLEIHGKFAYVCDAQNGIQVVDISVPSEASIVHNLDHPSWNAYKIAISGDLAYIGTTDVNIQLINITNPINITWIAQHTTPAASYDVAIYGDYLYTMCNQWGLQCIQVSKTLTSLENQKTVGLPSGPTHIDVDGPIAYVSTGSWGIHFINITKVPKFSYMNPMDYYSDAYSYTDLRVKNGIIFALTASGMFKILNATNPFAVTELGSLMVGTSVENLDVNGRVAYITTYDDGLRCINITNLKAPTEIGSYNPTIMSFTDIEVIGEIACIANESTGLVLLDVSDPTEPKFVNSLDWGQNPNTLDAEDDHVILGDDTGFAMINISDLTDLFLITSQTTSVKTSAVELTGDFVIMGSDAGDLNVYNVSDRSTIDFYGSLAYGTTFEDLEVAGDTVYVCDATNGVRSVRMRAAGSGDIDLDGLTNVEEIWSHDTDPESIDSDADLLNDGEEVNDYGTDPSNNDSDGDSLLDGSEVLTLNTEPDNPDTDGDGMRDDWEVAYDEVDPLIQDNASDPDGDGLVNIYEFGNKTDPGEPDTDGDGYSDLAEIEAGTDPNDDGDHPGGFFDETTTRILVMSLVGLVLIIGIYKAVKGKKKKKFIKKDEQRGPYFK